MKIVCISLSRIGSKRFPKKITQNINGKPLYEYTIELLNELKYPSYIYTDIEELFQYNSDSITIKRKPERYTQDIHLTNIELQEYNKDIQADIFVYLPMTAPIRNPVVIQNTITTLLDNIDMYDCAMSVRTLNERMYYQKDEYNNIVGCNFSLKSRTFNNSTTPTIKLYEETGNFYIFKKELIENNFFINERCLLVEDNINIDIDQEEDLRKAEKYIKG